MPEDNNRPSSAAETAIAATAAALEKIPIYQDAIQPAAKQVGQALETVLGFANLLLRPLNSLNLAGSKVAERIDAAIREKLQDHPESDLVEPKAYIAGNAIWSMATSLDEKPLRDLYANLLAAASLKTMQDSVHPSFAEVIRQLTPQEALLFSSIKDDIAATQTQIHFKEGGGYKILNTRLHWPGETPKIVDYPSIENLVRLGLIRLDMNIHFTNSNHYNELLTQHNQIEEQLKIVPELKKCQIQKGICIFTDFGKAFSKVCVSSDTWTW